jgi:hypothetical protein
MTPDAPSDIDHSVAPRGAGRERLIAALVLGTLTLIVFGDVLFRFDGTVISDPKGDISLYFARFRAFGFREMAHGNLVLWNPHVFSGAPFLGGFQSALLYPLNLMYLVLPLAFALNLDICVHTFLLGFFSFLWMRPQMRRIEPAIFAAALLMFSGPYALRVLAGQLTVLSSLAYAPLLLYAVDRVFEVVAARGRVLGPVLLGIGATSLQVVAGYPGTVFMTAFTVACYCLIRLIGARRRLFALAPLAAIALVPVGITAMQLWVGAETAAESIRAGGGSYAFASSFSFPMENLITLIAPGFFGDNIHAAYWGRWNFWDVSLFIGVAASLFAVAGVIWGRGRGGVTALGLGLLILAISLGRYTAFFGLLYDHVPGFQSFRAPSKFLFFAALFISLAAGLGFDALLVKAARARVLGWGAIGVAAALGAGAVWVSVAQTGGSDGAWARLVRSAKNSPEAYIWVEVTESYVAQAARAAVWSLALGGGAALAVGALLILAPRRPRLILATAAVGIVEVIVFSRVYRQTFALDTGGRTAINAAYAACKDGERVLDMVRFDGRVRNYAVEVGGRAVWGYDPVILKRYAEFACFAAGGTLWAEELRKQVFTWGSDPFGVALNQGFNGHSERGFQRDEKILALARPRFIVKAPVAPEYRSFVTYLTNITASAEERSGRALEKIVIDMPDAESFYEVPVVYPEFFFVNQYTIKPATLETLYQLSPASVDFGKVAVLEQAPEPAPVAEALGGGTAVAVDRGTDHFTFHVELPANAILMITDSYSRGWRVVPSPGSAQQKYAVLPADYAFMAIPLAAGVHDFRLEYAPAGYRYGRWISLASVAGYLAAVGLWARRRYRGVLRARLAGSR